MEKMDYLLSAFLLFNHLDDGAYKVIVKDFFHIGHNKYTSII